MKNFAVEICEQWQHNRLLLLTEALGTAMGITAGLMISILQSATPFVLIFSCYLCSSTLLAATAWKQNNSRLVVLNLVYTVINIFGLYNGIMLL